MFSKLFYCFESPNLKVVVNGPRRLSSTWEVALRCADPWGGTKGVSCPRSTRTSLPCRLPRGNSASSARSISLLAKLQSPCSSTAPSSSSVSTPLLPLPLPQSRHIAPLWPDCETKPGLTDPLQRNTLTRSRCQCNRDVSPTLPPFILISSLSSQALDFIESEGSVFDGRGISAQFAVDFSVFEAPPSPPASPFATHSSSAFPQPPLPPLPKSCSLPTVPVIAVFCCFPITLY